MKASRILIALIPLLLLGAREGSAQTDITIDTAFAYESEYVFRGIQFADHSFQPSMDIGWGGFYFGSWINAPIEDPNNSFLIEVDFYGGYGFDLSDTLSVDIGLTWYWFPEIPSAASSTREIYLGTAFDVFLAPSVYFYYDFDLSTFTVEASVGHSFPLGSSADSAWTLDLGAYLGFVAPEGGADGAYYGGSADISFAVSEHTAMSIGVRGSGISDDLSAGRTANVWWGMSFSAGF
jgi:uncharacterized protein (TIGR02001 family)